MRTSMLYLFAPQILHAASGAQAHGVPSVVWFQALNFILFVGILWFLLKNKITKFYLDRELKFKELSKSASAKKEEALKELKYFDMKLSEISNTRDAQIKKAKENSLKSNQTLLDQADAQSDKIKKESIEIANIEKKKTHEYLRNYLLLSSIKNVSVELSQVSSKAHSKLYNEFKDRVKNERL